MIGQTLATVIGLIIVAVLIIIDIWLATDRLPGNTWSELLRESSRHTLFIPWSLGVLMGHWFHPVDDFRAIAGGASIWILIALTAVLIVVGLVLGFAAKYTPPAWPWALGGLVAGALLWPVLVVA
jgi:hypothetical protein